MIHRKCQDLLSVKNKIEKNLDCHLFLILLGTLTITTSWANSADKFMMFFLFYQKTGFDTSCKLSPLKRQNLFSGKNKKNISTCRLLKILPRVPSIKS